MKPLRPLLAAATVAALAVPAGAIARDDGDVLPIDPASPTTVFAADGTATQGSLHGGERAFVDQLLAAHAAAGVLREDTAGYANPTTIRTGYSHPTTRLARLQGAAPGARGKVAVRFTTQADGRRTMERGLAVEIATGRIRTVTIEDARRFSADPLSGTAGVSYTYTIESNLPS
jgi:hypothetical protein